jgi:hypothetical protein
LLANALQDLTALLREVGQMILERRDSDDIVDVLEAWEALPQSK